VGGVATNLQLDDRLINQAVRLGKHKTKKEAVTQALADYVNRLKQQQILSAFGTIDYDPRYDYKRQRGQR
jgi:Arc/MetJ family transcription regulator